MSDTPKTPEEWSYSYWPLACIQPTNRTVIIEIIAAAMSAARAEALKEAAELSKRYWHDCDAVAVAFRRRLLEGGGE